MSPPGWLSRMLPAHSTNGRGKSVEAVSTAGSMDELADTIERAEEAIREYEAGLGRDASHARISLGDLPHALVPTSVIGRDLVRMLEDVVGPEAGPAVMYNRGKRIGRAQASAFFAGAGRDESDPAFRVLAGPFHFA